MDYAINSLNLSPTYHRGCELHWHFSNFISYYLLVMQNYIEMIGRILLSTI